MNALLLVAHGSRRAESNQEVTALADKLSACCSETYAFVHSAFLELAAPSIPEGIQDCIERGARSVVVLPYFLNSGRHVTEDIPAIVNQAGKDFVGVDIRIATHIGASELMTELLVTTAREAVDT